MPALVNRKNRQRSGYSFPRPAKKKGLGLSLLPPVPDQINAAVDSFPQASPVPIPSAPMPLNGQRLTDRYRAQTAALANPFDRQGAQAGYMGELAQVRDPFAEYQREISAGSAATQAAREAQRAQQTPEGIQRMYDAMGRVDMTPGSQKLAAIAAASPGELNTRERDVQLALRTQNPMQSTEIMPEDYAARIGQEYALDPESGRAQKTYYTPASFTADLAANREAYKTGRKPERAAELKERQDRRMFNRMAGTPAWQQARLQEAFDRAEQTETRGLLTDIAVAQAGRPPAVDANGNVMSSGVDPILQTLIQQLVGDSATTNLFTPSGAPPSSAVENQRLINATESGPLFKALGLEGPEGLTANDIGSATEENLDQLSDEEFAELRQYLQSKGPDFIPSFGSADELLLRMIRDKGRVSREEIEAVRKKRRRNATTEAMMFDVM